MNPKIKPATEHRVQVKVHNHIPTSHLQKLDGRRKLPENVQ